jgi:hypothetical protein
VKKLPTFKPSLVTKEFFSGYDDVSVINEGECFIWAYTAYVIFQGVEVWYNDHHAFVKYRNRFFDSERLKGVSDWRDLPATEGGGMAAKTSIVNFKKAWAHNPRNFGTSWDQIEANARKVLRREQASI